MTPTDDNLLKHLDLIHFWEPFDRPINSLRVGIRAIIKDRKEKHKLALEKSSTYSELQCQEFESPLIFSFNTTNQKTALMPLFERLSDKATLISENLEYTDEVRSDEYLKIRSLEFSTQMIRWFYTFTGRDRKVFRARFYEFYKRLGQYIHYHQAFDRSKEKIKGYIASNDHSGLSQVGFVAARRSGIPTIYVQHASVSEKFSPLKATLALLDGQDAKEKYLWAGPTDSKIHLIGSMKYDHHLNQPEMNEPGELVGVCIGMAYHDLNENLQLCQELEKNGVPFCLRFHPLLSPLSKAAFIKAGWEVSPPDESALDFVFRCHTVISGDSNILLEAIILRRRPLYFASDGKGVDYYGFVKKGVCEKTYFTYQEVIQGLNQEFDLSRHRKKASHFNAVLETDQEGKSTEKAMEIIETTL